MSDNHNKKYNPIKVMTIVFIWVVVEFFLLSFGLDLTNQPDDLMVLAGVIVLFGIPVTTFKTFHYLIKNYK